MAQQFELEGTQEVLDALDALDPKELSKVILATERKALSKHIITPLRAGVPYSADSKKSIRIASIKNDKTGLDAGIHSDRFWLRFVEYGTGDRETKKGWYRGAITAKPAVIPIIESNVENVVTFFTQDFGEAVDAILMKRLKKLAKQQARIQRTEKRVKADGVVTAKERAVLDNQQDRANRNIVRKKHNNRDRN